MRCVLIIIALALFANPVFSGQLSPKLAAAVTGMRSDEVVSVIVTLAERPDSRKYKDLTHRMLSVADKNQRRKMMADDLRRQADRSQENIRAYLRNKNLSFQKLWIDNSLVVTATPDVVAELAAMPEVMQVKKNEVLTRAVVPAAATGGVENNILRINADALWAQGISGAGSVVACLDSGVDGLHPDLAPKFTAGGWFNPIAPLCGDISLGLTCGPCGLNETSPCDTDGHGTGVAGVMVGGTVGVNAPTAIGVAPDATWMAVKIFDDHPDTTQQKSPLSTIHAAFQWLLDPVDKPVPDVVVNSWDLAGPNQFIDEFQSDIQLLKAAGISVVFAAGNTGPYPASSVSPGNYPEALAVGSVNSFDVVSSFSARGPSAYDGVTTYPDIVAPGENIRTADISFNGAFNFDQTVSGTSFAAPHVAGVVALLRQAFPVASMDDIEGALLMSAEDLGTQGPDNSYGYGLIDAQAAYNYLLGAADISVHDPVAPENDLQLPFGSLPLGASQEHIITVSNLGGAILTLGQVDLSELTTPFSISADNCSFQSLYAGEFCDVVVNFAPDSPGQFQGKLAFPSNDISDPEVAVSVTGNGNSAPAAPVLLSPANGSVDLHTTVTLRWAQFPDSDGDLLETHLFLSTDPGFSGAAPEKVTDIFGQQSFYYSGISVCVLLLPFWRRRRLSVLLLLIAASCVFVSCGGHSDDHYVRYSHVVDGLAPRTTYYWKISVDDGSSAPVSSPVWHFTTN